MLTNKGGKIAFVIALLILVILLLSLGATIEHYYPWLTGWLYCPIGGC